MSQIELYEQARVKVNKELAVAKLLHGDIRNPHLSRRALHLGFYDVELVWGIAHEEEFYEIIDSLTAMKKKAWRKPRLRQELGWLIALWKTREAAHHGLEIMFR